MLKNVKHTIDRTAMLSRGDHLLVAVSGGPDSIALLHVLILLSSAYRLKLTTAHLNHGLRGAEAQAEEDFVRRISREQGITCICKTIDIGSLQRGSGRSLEEIGREERYRFLNDTADRCGAQKIATGHHKNDQAETLLINLIRGSGLEGMKGIAPVRERIIRPLLDVTRKEISEFLRAQGLQYVSDSSNCDMRYFRNRIRNVLLPDLASYYNPRIVPSLCRVAHIIRRDDEYLQDTVNRILQEWGVSPGTEEIALSTDSFLGLHEALQARIAKLLLDAALTSGRGVALNHVEAVLRLAARPFSRKRISLDLPGLICVEKVGGMIRIIRKDARRTRQDKSRKETPVREYRYPVHVPGSVYIPEIDRRIRTEVIRHPGFLVMQDNPRVAFFDYRRISPPLFVRNFKPGDRFNPLGMAATKKVNRYFIDRKIPHENRGRIPLLVDSRSVIWIAGESISDRVKISPETETVVRAEMV
ncbi:MAG: tRNA lysidine(34) synthetase TilS [Syntrophales bacterium]